MYMIAIVINRIILRLEGKGIYEIDRYVVSESEILDESSMSMSLLTCARRKVTQFALGSGDRNTVLKKKMIQKTTHLISDISMPLSYRHR